MENKENRELFEKNLKELEVVVKELEGGDVTLDQMLELFEKGVKLTKQCTAALDAAEQKINILIKNTFSPYLGIMIFPLSSISTILFTFFVDSFFCLEKSFSNRIFSVCKVKGVVIDTKSAPTSFIIYLS